MNRDLEQKIAATRGWITVVGVDEAGKGPLAGPVYAAACLLGDAEIDGLNDSKQISEKKREKLYDEIIEKAAGYAVCAASAADVDALGIDTCTMDCMVRAVSELKDRFVFDGALIDGNRMGRFSVPAMCVVKGDAKCPSIAAASILAKVSRDRYMRKVHERYPDFLFDKHKGYGTALHFELIDRFGTCREHRMSFLQKHFAKSVPRVATRGDAGEDIALKYLRRKGYELLERNFRVRTGELDLVMQSGRFIAFVEVKLRKNADFGSPCEFVDRKKQQKIIGTALEWLQQNACSLQPRFDIVEVYMAENESEPQRVTHIENAFTNEVR